MATANPPDDGQMGSGATATTANTPGARWRLANGARGSVASLRKRNVRTRAVVPWSLLFAFLLASLITVVTQAHRYGITIDEPLQQAFGEVVLAWYRSFGKDTRFLTTFAPIEHLPEHGGIFDAVVVAVQSHFLGVDPWLVRHIVTGVVGWLGVVAIALCGYELGGPWVALAAAVGLWLYPRYYGAMYNNPKDIPAAVSMLFVLWATLVLLRYRRQHMRSLEVSALLGLFLGAATAIRVTALSWFAVLAALLVGWWLVNGRVAWRERRLAATLAWQGAVTVVVACVWLLATALLWPFVFLNPVANLIESFQVMSHFPWDGTTLFNGVVYPAARIPMAYVPTWLVIGSPPMLLALAALGVAIALAETARRRHIDPAVAVVALAFVIPLVSLLALHPVLYDTLRQFLFMIPPLILLAAYGLVRAVAALLRQRRFGPRGLAVALLAVTVVSYALVAADMAALSPYEYTYFSPLVGGLRGAAGKYETDYYGTCRTAAAAWLAQNYRQYTASSSPTVDTPFQELDTLDLPGDFTLDTSQPDFYIGFTRFNFSQLYPTYRVIHTVSVEGTLLCVVKVKPAE